MQETGEGIAFALAVVGLKSAGAGFGVVTEIAAFEDDAQQGFGRDPFVGEEWLGKIQMLGQERE